MNIEYQIFLNKCMLEFVKNVLAKIEKANLYLDQLIYISYRTDNPSVVLPMRVKQAHPQEITVVLQHQFENLIVQEEGFSVSVSFYGIKENIYIPFDSLISIVDSANHYSLVFNQRIKTPNYLQAKMPEDDESVKIVDKDNIEKLGSKDVIVLDNFRNPNKKPPK